MTAMPPMRDILNNTPADAVDVDFNFKNVQSHIAAEMINRDGSVAMTAPLTTQPPTAAAHAATKAYVDAILPVGMMVPYAGQSAPAGWALCDGSSQTRTDPAYAALFAVIGTSYGAVDASHFNLPDMLGRVAIGRYAGNTVIDTIGKKAGSYTAVLPDHYHTIVHNHSASAAAAGLHAHTINVPGTFGGPLAAAPTNIGSAANLTGDAGSHTHTITVDTLVGGTSGNAGVSPVNGNLQPCTVINYIIRIG